MAGPELLTETARLRARREALSREVMRLQVHGRRRRRLLQELASLTFRLLVAETATARDVAHAIRESDRKWWQR